MTDLDLVVSDVASIADGVRRIVLRRPDGGILPSFAPGSSIAVVVGAGSRNSYSLTGPNRAPDHYAIAVRREDVGRGGSRWLHALAVGDGIAVSAPISAFPPVLTARHHLLIAAGIGVTPILSHVRAAVEWNRSFDVLYIHRPGGGAHLADLEELCGGRVQSTTDRARFRRLLDGALGSQCWGTHLYVCGPPAMIDDVRDAAHRAGWPDARVHAEAFLAAATNEGAPFEARLTRAGRRVRVESGVSLLDALLRDGVAVPNMCRQGVCGECRVAVRPTSIDHRDTYLTREERDRGDCMMACVSRPTDDVLEVDL